MTSSNFEATIIGEATSNAVDKVVAFLEGKVPRDVGKGNTVYKFRSGFCLEPSHFPDSLNHADFPPTTLNPGDWYSGKIVYRFSTDRAGMPVAKGPPAKSDVKK
jgi:galactose mutarotase-like enzyme